MYTMNYAEVGSNIQKALAERNMTQQKLADALSVSKQVMSKIINGNKAINVRELMRIAEILGMKADELLMTEEAAETPEIMSFMGTIRDDETKKRIELLRTAIDEIHFLEELINE